MLLSPISNSLPPFEAACPHQMLKEPPLGTPLARMGAHSASAAADGSERLHRAPSRPRHQGPSLAQSPRVRPPPTQRSPVCSRELAGELTAVAAEYTLLCPGAPPPQTRRHVRTAPPLRTRMRMRTAQRSPLLHTRVHGLHTSRAAPVRSNLGIRRSLSRPRCPSRTRAAPSARAASDGHGFVGRMGSTARARMPQMRAWEQAGQLRIARRPPSTRHQPARQSRADMSRPTRVAAAADARTRACGRLVRDERRLPAEDLHARNLRHLARPPASAGRRTPPQKGPWLLSAHTSRPPPRTALSAGCGARLCQRERGGTAVRAGLRAAGTSVIERCPCSPASRQQHALRRPSSRRWLCAVSGTRLPAARCDRHTVQADAWAADL
jgi:hypothetical protein